jgi:hypothetical protein
MWWEAPQINYPEDGAACAAAFGLGTSTLTLLAARPRPQAITASGGMSGFKRRSRRIRRLIFRVAGNVPTALRERLLVRAGAEGSR